MDFDSLTQQLLVAFLNNSNNKTDLTVQLKNGFHRLARHSTHWRQKKDHTNIAASPALFTKNPLHSSSEVQWSVLPSISSGTLMPTSANEFIISPMPTPARLQQSAESAAFALSAQLNSQTDAANSDGILYDIFLHSEQHSKGQKGNSSWLDGSAGFNPGDTSIVNKLDLMDFVIGIVLAIVTLATVIGNALVIMAILRERHLRSVGNYLVFSLALADLMVACLVMPLGALYVVTGQWTLGAAFCDLWTTVDVLCCTASILHLLAIAIVSLILFYYFFVISLFITVINIQALSQD